MSRDIFVRETTSEDFPGIIALTKEVYPNTPAWSEEALASHTRIFPEGQAVAVDPTDDSIVGMSASLVILWDDYEMEDTWRDFTDHGMFTNHDPEYGRTLYGAEVMVSPSRQGQGIGKKLYQARQELAERLGLLRIRAGARLRNYHKYADKMSAEEYTLKVIAGEIGDPTLSFQLRRGFRVLAVVSGYLKNDPESLGYAAVIEWLNPHVATKEDYEKGDPKFRAAAKEAE